MKETIVLSLRNESPIPLGAGVIAGSDSCHVTMPGEFGGNCIGVYDASYSGSRDIEEADSIIPVTVFGKVRLRCGGSVDARQAGTLKPNSSGEFTAIPQNGHNYQYCGFFLDDGKDGDFVDFFLMLQPSPSRHCRTYIAEGTIAANSPVYQGSEANKVTNIPGDFIGITEQSAANGQPVAVTIHGPAITNVAGTAAAGKDAGFNSSGNISTLPANSGIYQSPGIFLSSGVDALVEFFVNRRTITIE